MKHLVTKTSIALVALSLTVAVPASATAAGTPSAKTCAKLTKAQAKKKGCKTRPGQVGQSGKKGG